jgi:hypothetical protein
MVLGTLPGIVLSLQWNTAGIELFGQIAQVGNSLLNDDLFEILIFVLTNRHYTAFSTENAV